MHLGEPLWELVVPQCIFEHAKNLRVFYAIEMLERVGFICIFSATIVGLTELKKSSFEMSRQRLGYGGLEEWTCAYNHVCMRRGGPQFL